MSTWQCFDGQEPINFDEHVKCIFCGSENNNVDDWKLDVDSEYKFFCPDCGQISVEEDYEVKE